MTEDSNSLALVPFVKAAVDMTSPSSHTIVTSGSEVPVKRSGQHKFEKLKEKKKAFIYLTYKFDLMLPPFYILKSISEEYEKWSACTITTDGFIILGDSLPI